jgi:hypothetical protein
MPFTYKLAYSASGLATLRFVVRILSVGSNVLAPTKVFATNTKPPKNSLKKVFFSKKSFFQKNVKK